MLNFYIDETYKKTKSGDYYCNIGGVIIVPEKSIDLELELRHTQFEIIKEFKNDPGIDYDRSYMDLEVKLTNFLDNNYTDEIKFKLFESFIKILEKYETTFFISNVECKKENQLNISLDYQDEIQHLAFMELNWHLEKYTKSNIVQIIVDLGLNESFKPVYKIYSEIFKACALQSYINEDNLPLPYYKSLPPPVFIDSKDSKILQLSDIVIGLTLKSQMKQLNGFHENLYKKLKPIESRIIIKHKEYFTRENYEKLKNG